MELPMYRYKAEDYINSRENITINKYLATKEEKEHTHDFIEIEYIWCGRGVQVVNGREHSVEKGDMVFLNFGDRHSFYPEEELGILNCIINPEFVSSQLVNSANAMDILSLVAFKDFAGDIDCFLPGIRFAGTELLEIEKLLEFMKAEFDIKAPGYMTALKAYMDILLIKIFRTIKSAGEGSVYNDMGKIAPTVLKFIEDNYSRKITLKELAQYGFYNPSYFSRIFKECYGKTVTEYINEKRLEAAMRLIGETDLTIENVSLQIGYNDKKQFYKLFREATGSTPEKYRLSLKK